MVDIDCEVRDMCWMLTYRDETRVVRGGYDQALSASEDMALDLGVQGCEIAIDRIPEMDQTQKMRAIKSTELVWGIG